MKVVICGSLGQREEILLWDRRFQELGAETISPFSSDIQDLNIFEKRCQYISAIENADVVIFVTKCVFSEYSAESEDYIGLTMGESTSYEYGLARHFNKPIMFV